MKIIFLSTENLIFMYIFIISLIKNISKTKLFIVCKISYKILLLQNKIIFKNRRQLNKKVSTRVAFLFTRRMEEAMVRRKTSWDEIRPRERRMPRLKIAARIFK